MTGVMAVTGGGRGIGAAVARLAGARGFGVAVLDREPEVARRVADEIASAGGRSVAIAVDVGSEDEVATAFRRVDNELGRLSHLVNNAGITGRKAVVADLDPDELRRVFATNVFGSFLCAREAVRRMATDRGGEGGVIVNVSSRAAVHGQRPAELPYVASKGAIDSFTVGLAHEVADCGIRVAGVRPGVVMTDLALDGGTPEALADFAREVVPLKRWAEADEVARAILWLCSPEASYVTGTMLDVSGGR